jgi:hypothetical protein
LWERRPSPAGLWSGRASTDRAARARERRRRCDRFPPGRPFSIAAFTIRNGKIAELDFLVDPERIARLDLTVLGD